MENKILESFKNKMSDEVKNMDLIVSIDDLEETREINCEIMETKENGKVWNVVCDKSGNVIDFYEVND